MADIAIPKNPTNNDIMLILVQMNSTLESVKEQATKTNGRVNSIEEWKTGLLAVELYKHENPQPVQQNIKSQTVIQARPAWWENKTLVNAIVAIGIAISLLIPILISYLTSGVHK